MLSAGDGWTSLGGGSGLVDRSFDLAHRATGSASMVAINAERFGKSKSPELATLAASKFGLEREYGAHGLAA